MCDAFLSRHKLLADVCKRRVTKNWELPKNGVNESDWFEERAVNLKSIAASCRGGLISPLRSRSILPCPTDTAEHHTVKSARQCQIHSEISREDTPGGGTVMEAEDAKAVDDFTCLQGKIFFTSCISLHSECVIVVSIFTPRVSVAQCPCHHSK